MVWARGSPRPPTSTLAFRFSFEKQKQRVHGGGLDDSEVQPNIDMAEISLLLNLAISKFVLANVKVSLPWKSIFASCDDYI